MYIYARRLTRTAVLVADGAGIVSVPALEPSVEELLEVIHVLLAGLLSIDVTLCHADEPAIVLTDGPGNVSIGIAIEHTCEVFGTPVDVEPWVSWVATWCTAPFVGGDLHQTTHGDTGIAG